MCIPASCSSHSPHDRWWPPSDGDTVDDPVHFVVDAIDAVQAGDAEREQGCSLGSGAHSSPNVRSTDRT
jgi:hypothetical protein